MDDRSAKRQRQLENRSDTTCYISGANGGGGTSTKQIPAGCYLEIRSATSHIFLGQPVEVEVRLLNDEDVVQPTTVGINATVMSEDGKVLTNNPDKFQLTPTRPALLDGTSTFQLVLAPGTVQTGSRVRVHVEASAGGVQVQFQVTANSGQLMVCRSALNVVRPPPENWYKDEGGRNNCIEIEVQVREKTPGASQPGRPQPGVPLNLTLVYDSGTEVQTQDILQIQADTQLFTNETGRAQLKFKITEVSQRHQSQKFRVKISPDTKANSSARDIAPVVTVPIQVLSKRKNRKIREKPAQGAVVVHSAMNLLPLPSSRCRQTFPALCPLQPSTSAMTSASPPQGHHWSSPSPGIGRMLPHSAPTFAHHPVTMAASTAPMVEAKPPPQAVFSPQSPAPQPIPSPVSPSLEGSPLRVPVKDAQGPLGTVLKWVDAVVQLLEASARMELQWEFIGYEREDDRSVCYSKPLWRCPVCRVCKGYDAPRQKHADHCRLGGLLNEFKDSTRGNVEALVKEHRAGAASLAASKGGGSEDNSGDSSRGGAMRVGGVSWSGGRSPLFYRGRGDAGYRWCRRLERDANVFLTNAPSSFLLLPCPPQHRRLSFFLFSFGTGAILTTPCAGTLVSGPPQQQQHRYQSPDGPAPNNNLFPGISASLVRIFSFPPDVNSSGDGGMPRQGSAAFFKPKRTKLTPTEEKAVFIMLTTADGDGKPLSVFSRYEKLLGFYDEKVEGDQANLPFLDITQGHCISEDVKTALEAKLAAALGDDSDRAGRANGADDREAMETEDDDPAAAGNSNGNGGMRNRPPAPTPGLKTSPKHGTPGVKRESGGMSVDGGGGGTRPRMKGVLAGVGARGVYKLWDFKDYHEMKEKV
ncbi:unnamed protein product, partial [Ascophyllum nodosum]